MKSYQQLVEKKQPEILKEIIVEAYFDIPKEVIAQIISKYHDIKITDSLIESYVEITSNRRFSLDPVIIGIRERNKLDQRFEFVLEDSSTITITEESFNHIKSAIEHNYEAVKYMNESKDNFMAMFNLIASYKDKE